MDPKELEDKLEKDNLTLKEHILKLQNTIKNIKSELSHTNNNTTYVNTLSQIDISTIKNSKIESPKNNGKLNIKDDSDEEINNLKFSFKNIKAEQKLLEENRRKREAATKNKQEEENINAKNKFNNEIDNTKNKYEFEKKDDIIKNDHVYKNNLSKLKSEKDIIEKMENVRNNSNIKKLYNDPNPEDDLEYEKFQKINKLKNKNNKANYNNIENEREIENYHKFNLDDLNFKNVKKNDIYKNINFHEYDNEEKNESHDTKKKMDEVDMKYNIIPKYRNSIC